MLSGKQTRVTVCVGNLSHSVKNFINKTLFQALRFLFPWERKERQDLVPALWLILPNECQDEEAWRGGERRGGEGRRGARKHSEERGSLPFSLS